MNKISDADRAQFESWAEASEYSMRRGFGPNNDYESTLVRRMWEGWQAALASVQPSPAGQGDAAADLIPRLRQEVQNQRDALNPLYMNDVGRLLNKAAVALAATGKQQVGVFPWENLPAYLIDKCEGETISEEGIQRAVADMAKDARYCPSQQVGEVQS